MKKLTLVLLLVLGGVLLAVGVCSLVFLQEDRLPAVTLPTLLDHSATAALEDAYGEGFPLRDRLLALNRSLNRFYYFSVGGDNLLAIDYQGGAEYGGERLQDLPEPVSQTPPPELPQIDVPEQADVAVGTIIVSGNRAMDIPTATDDLIVQYGETVSRIAAAMPEGVRTFSLITPNGGQFYSPVDFHTGVHDQKAMIDLCYGTMQGVRTVDAYLQLALHADEYIFFRTDHHWTQKGAYYAYRAFCDAAGFTAPALDTYETGSYEGFVGSMYNYTSGYPQSQALLDNPDTLTYYLPQTETRAAYYADDSLTNGVPIPVIDVALRDEVTNKYLCFLGGDTPICVIDTGIEGGTCMVLKESFGNAFVPFLTQHYSRILTVDPREFGGEGKPALDLAAFARAQGVDDLLILDYPFMISSEAYIGILGGLLG